MLEYFAYKKFKKTKTEKEARELARQEADEHAYPANNGKSSEALPPLLDQNDEAFFEALINTSDDEAHRPTLPPRRSGFDSDSSPTGPSSQHRLPRSKTANSALSVESASADIASRGPATVTKTKTKGKDDDKKHFRNPISMLLHRKDNKDKQLVLAGKASEPAAVPLDEEAREREDLSRVLDDLNLGANRNNKAFALSADNNDLVRKFTLILRDLVNGVPTAVDDLRAIIDDRDGTLKRNYDKLPSSMKKLVAQLPDKVTKNMGPEMLAVAAESQGMKRDERGAKDTAKSLFMPKNLNDIVTKPSAIIGMLKAIVNFLKLRWPAFIGVNAVWSIAIFLLLLVLWYCHKRGREVRLDREQSENAIDGSDRVEELPDDLMLPGPPSRASSHRSAGTRSSHSRPSSYRRSSRRDVSPPLESPRRRATHR